MLPSGEAVCCVPNTLVALCLNTGGLARVRSSRALRCFLPIFTSRQYLRALQVRPRASSVKFRLPPPHMRMCSDFEAARLPAATGLVEKL